MIRKLAIPALVAMASLIAPAATKTAAADPAPGPFIIKFGTVAPKVSSWGKVFEAWKRTVKKDSSGACELDWAYSGQAGDEKGMIQAMKSKALHGAALTATGLSMIYPSVVALQMPGLVDPLLPYPRNWQRFDKVRDAAKPTFDTAFENAGYKILGWGDVGVGHVMFRKGEGKPDIKTPESLKAYHPFYFAGDPIGSTFLAALGIQSPKALGVPGVLPELMKRSDDSIDVITTPAIAAEQLQWAPHVSHVVDMPIGFGIGALIIDKEYAKSIPEACKGMIADSGKSAGDVLTQTIRGKDDEAWNDLKRTKQVVTLSGPERDAWLARFADLRQKLKAEGKVSAASWDAVTAAAAAAK